MGSPPKLPHPTMPQRSFSLQELSQFDGHEGRPVYVAYQGSVYDVSQSYHWRRGRHQVVHVAGHDLTDELADAPHSAELLRKFPIVGVLEDSPP